MADNHPWTEERLAALERAIVPGARIPNDMHLTVLSLIAEVRRLRANVLAEREACADIVAREARRLWQLTSGPSGRTIEAIAVALEKGAAAIRAREP